MIAYSQSIVIVTTKRSFWTSITFAIYVQTQMARTLHSIKVKEKIKNACIKRYFLLMI